MVGVIIQGTGESYRRIEPTNFLDCSLASIQIDLLEMESFDLLSAKKILLPLSLKEKMGVKGLASSHICSNQLHDYKTGRP